MDRGVRSRTNSTSSLRSPGLPATPSHTPTHASYVLRHIPNHQHISADQLAAGISRLRAERVFASRSSSIPATPAPTPNPQLQVTYHVFPEQLAAGIRNLKVDEGYVDSSSFPATPAPTPFSPSPRQSTYFSPDQVAEGIQKLTEQGFNTSEVSTGQPPTPSTTPGIGPAAGAQHLGVLPARLVESINHLGGDEGLESGSNPGTPIPTPLSPSPAVQRIAVPPEQLAAGLHRLKTDEGLSSGGSSGFPSTPAPTPFCPNTGGVRPEELAAGISRLSVIEEGVPNAMEEAEQPQLSNSQLKSIKTESEQDKSLSQVIETTEKSRYNDNSEPNLSQYFGEVSITEKNPNFNQKSFFDQLDRPNDGSLLHSCSASRVDLPELEQVSAKVEANVADAKENEAQIDVEQRFDDDESFRHRRFGESFDKSQQHFHSSLNNEEQVNIAKENREPVVCNIFKGTEEKDPFEAIIPQVKVENAISSESSGLQCEATEKPSRKLTPMQINQFSSDSAESSTPTALSPNYSTPVAETPSSSGVGSQTVGYSSYFTSTPLPNPNSLRETGIVSHFVTPEHLKTNQPITSPLPLSTPIVPAPQQQLSPLTTESIEMTEEMQDMEKELFQDRQSARRNYAWISNSATEQILRSVSSEGNESFYPDRNNLTMPSVANKGELEDPIRNLVAHFQGESEASKRIVPSADSVSSDLKGLRSLVKSGCYRAAVNLTGKLLNTFNQGHGQTGSLSVHTPVSLQIWYTRILLLMKLRQFSVAEVEAEPFGDLDRPDLYFEYYGDKYSHSNLKGSMVPFGFRLLVAQIPQHLGKPNETFNRLQNLLTKVALILENLSKGKTEIGTEEISDEDREQSYQLWKDRERQVYFAIANCAVMQKDFDLAVETLETVLEKEEPERKSKVQSAIGRVYLQLGDIERAKKCFSDAYTQESNWSTGFENFMDMGALAVATSDYENALESFQKANEISPGNAAVLNNIAVCLLYVGKLKEGLTFLETNMTSNPNLLLHEVSICNLCTLYELESSYAGQKKRAILDLVTQFKGDGINQACLKL